MSSFSRSCDTLDAMSGIVREIYRAEGAGEAACAVNSIRAIAGQGLEGDRYALGTGSFSRWAGEGRAVSLIELEAIEAIAAECRIDLTRGRHRRNIVTSGVALSELIGRKFRIGSAVLRGTRACTECRYLDRLTEPGVYGAMKGRGGLRADIIE